MADDAQIDHEAARKIAQSISSALDSLYIKHGTPIQDQFVGVAIALVAEAKNMGWSEENVRGVISALWQKVALRERATPPAERVAGRVVGRIGKRGRRG